jgi:hypothetical protein
MVMVWLCEYNLVLEHICYYEARDSKLVLELCSDHQHTRHGFFTKEKIQTKNFCRNSVKPSN